VRFSSPASMLSLKSKYHSHVCMRTYGQIARSPVERSNAAHFRFPAALDVLYLAPELFGLTVPAYAVPVDGPAVDGRRTGGL
jgi:hypothetical protein